MRRNMQQEIQFAVSGAQPRTAFAVGGVPSSEAADQTGKIGADCPDASQTKFGKSGPGRAGEAASTRRTAECVRVSPATIPAEWLIWFYRNAISPYLPKRCRFTPTCSQYALEAYRIHGFWKGSGLTLWRLLRCQPFCRGAWDPVPPAKSKRIQQPDDNL